MNYKLIEKIYETDSIEVLRGEEIENKNIYIYKVAKRNTPPIISQLKYEYEFVKKISLNGVIPPVYFQSEFDRTYIAFEDFQGMSLKEYAKAYLLNLEMFLEVGISISKTLGELHNMKVVHKDIKPANILINPATFVTKIIDFGIATEISRSVQNLVPPQELEGSLQYISPEQTGRMNRVLDYRTDLYSLGVCFYEILTGQLPFNTKNPMELIHSHIAIVPLPPNKINPVIPDIISKIILKLLEKNAEDRYQSAFGLAEDLKFCLTNLKTLDNTSFTIGKKDFSGRLQIPQKLYGREREIKTLLDTFENLVTKNEKTFISITGFSGVGKSSLVQEIYKPIAEKKGIYLSGKFDQYQKNIPYYAFTQLFNQFCNYLLREEEGQLKEWKNKLKFALGSNARVLFELIPDLELLFPEEPPIQELGSQESQNRFNFTFHNFFQAICTNEHPLVIFIDDLQWADSASLNLLKNITTFEDNSYFLPIGSYRVNEVDATHPLTKILNEIKSANVNFLDLVLENLAIKDLENLLSETLSTDVDKISPLAIFLHKRTTGNAFFINQFLLSMYEEGHLYFNYENNSWDYDLDKIENMKASENVVELMTFRFKKLEESTQVIMKLAAVIGNQFDLNFLSIIYGKNPVQTLDSLWEAIEEGLILPLNENYKRIRTNAFGNITPSDCIFKFLHDRVQQAAYSLIDDSMKKENHLKIGRLLLKNIDPKEVEDKVFDIVNQLNAGIDLVTDEDEKKELANLNLLAGIKAKNSTAFVPALNYFSTGLQLLNEECWNTNYKLTLTLHRETGEAEYVIGNFERSRLLFSITLNRAHSNLDKVQIYSIQMNLYMTTGDFKAGIDSGINALKILGLNVPTSESELSNLVAIEEREVSKRLAEKDTISLFEMPEMIDKEKIAIMQLLVDLFALAYMSANYTLRSYVVLRINNMSLQEGNTSLSAFGYVSYGVAMVGEGKFKEAFELGTLALKLNEKFHNSNLTGKINNLLGLSINPYSKHLKINLPLYETSYQSSMSCGDLTYAGWALFFIMWTRFEISENLFTLSEAADKYFPSVEKINDLNMTYSFKVIQRVIWNLIGKTTELFNFNDESFQEERSIEYWKSNDFDHGINWYSYLKAQILFMYDKIEECFQICKDAEVRVAANVGFFPVTKYNFYYCLSITSIYNSKSSSEKEELLKTLSFYQDQMRRWAENGSENFLHKYQLIEAERLRITGNLFDALKSYDKSIESAKKNGYVQDEALANELCANYWLEQGKEDFAKVYLRKAIKAYRIWGSNRKVSQLENKYPFLIRKKKEILSSDLGNTNTITTNDATSTSKISSSSLDMISVIKSSSAITQEIELEKLLSRITSIMAENAGAEKAYFILKDGEEYTIQSAMEGNDEEIVVMQNESIEDSNRISKTIVNLAIRTKKLQLVDEARTDNRLVQDKYVQEKKPISILCLPILNKSELKGLLYLENNKAIGAFTQQRTETLQLIASQAAISIEIAKLYSNMQVITAEKSRIQTEMDLAQRIQTSLLPEKTELRGYETIGYMKTADEVGGDYYDTIIEKDRQFAVIGDVSGHGVTSGLVMMMAQTILHTIIEAKEEENTAQILSRANTTLSKNILKLKESKYMTMTLFEMEASGKVKYAGAHLDSLVYRKKTNEIEKLESKGFWLGMEKDITPFLVEQETKLWEGDILLLYTDGLTEATNNRELYGSKLLGKVLQDNSMKSLEGIKTSILESLTNFETLDDVTMLIIKKLEKDRKDEN